MIVQDADLTAEELITAYVLETVEREPVARQILLYRAITAITKDRALSAQCLRLADELEQSQRGQRKLALEYRIRAEGSRNPFPPSP